VVKNCGIWMTFLLLFFQLTLILSTGINKKANVCDNKLSNSVTELFIARLLLEGHSAI